MVFEESVASILAISLEKRKLLNFWRTLIKGYVFLEIAECLISLICEIEC